MRDLDSFRRAGRAGRVDDVGQIFRTGPELRGNR